MRRTTRVDKAERRWARAFLWREERLELDRIEQRMNNFAEAFSIPARVVDTWPAETIFSTGSRMSH